MNEIGYKKITNLTYSISIHENILHASIVNYSAPLEGIFSLNFKYSVNVCK